MKSTIFKLAAFLLLSAVVVQNVFAQGAEPSRIVLLNTGQMNIANNSATSIRVNGSVRMTNAPSILCDGIWQIQGSFFHDADTNVFVIDDAGKTTSLGKVVFFDANSIGKRFIAPSDVETDEFASVFDRVKSYIAFPNIVISTTDTVFVPAKMAFDAISITDTLEDGSHSGGKLLLASAEVGGKVYDASLRVTGVGTSAELVSKNAVIVEKWVETYRSSAGQLFSYATPFDNTQFAGYFAGNWLRTPSKDDNGHSVYVMANKPSASGSSVIAADQYVSDVFELLEPALPYFIKPRVSNFDYGTLFDADGLNYTFGGDATVYNKDKFVFDGNIYDIALNEEQLFADDVLFSHTFAAGTATGTINWVIGNSYTSAISVDSLAKRLKAETAKGVGSGIQFVDVLYVYPAGSTSFQSIDMSDLDSPILLGEFKEIPAMSVFMIRIKNGSPLPGGTFTLGKDLLVHSNTQNNFGSSDIVPPSPSPAPSRQRIISNAAPSTLNNQVIFSVSDADNDNVFDLAAIGLRENARWGADDYDFSKITGGGDGFQLYTVLSEKTSTKLSINGLPLDADSALMYFNPTFKAESMMIELAVQGKETLTSEDFWLEDLQTGETHRFTGNEPYYFTSYSDDDPARFVVHFKPQNIMGGTTKEEQIDEDNNLLLYSVNKQIFIENLLQSDLGADVNIYDATGKLIDAFAVSQFPKMIYNTKNLMAGVYIVRLQGAKTLKMIIK
ncbi:MAG: T9SS type A sorting domain-containing protein [Prevotellaceae bacterium]|nr:T9SS type A sorting domain-containing protein [Prevotellaceae bacterium]